MKNARRELQANSDVRRLYHDTKNHLMAIRSMAGKSGEIEEYLDGLLSHFNSYEAQIDTGNATVNALLSDKIQRAHPEEILFNVRLDLSALNKVSSIDLVTIFGNAIDNAVEALRSIDDDGKIVFIKNKYFA